MPRKHPAAGSFVDLEHLSAHCAAAGEDVGRLRCRTTDAGEWRRPPVNSASIWFARYDLSR
jgi:hypothetical protein